MRIEANAGRVHVLQVVSGLAIGEPLGGAELFGAELVRHLNPDECVPMLCAVWRRGGPAERYWVERLRSNGIEVFFAADYRGQFSFPAFLRGVQAIGDHLAGRRVDVIHSHFQVGSVATLLLRRRLGARAILRTAHITVEWGPSVVGYLCRQTLTSWLFPYAFDVEAGVSQAVVDQLDRRPGARIGRRRAVFIPNGIALDRFEGVAKPTPGEIRQLGLSPDKLTVGSVGRLTGQKGYTYFLEAARTIVAQRQDVQFVLIGDGDLRDELQAYRDELGLQAHVHFLGARRDVASLLRSLDLFVLPSLWEGLPTVIMEAMASGVPVVATDILGTRELVKPGRNGWLVEPKDASGLADAITAALSDPERRLQMAQTALRETVPLYSMEAIACQYMGLYRTLLSARR